MEKIKRPGLPSGREVKPLWVLSIICFILAAALLANSRLSILSVAETEAIALDGQEHKAYKGMTEGGMGEAVSEISVEEYYMLNSADDKSLGVATTGESYYPLIRFEYSLADIEGIDSITFQAEAWSKNMWGDSFIMLGVWNGTKNVWETSSTSKADIWSHSQSGDGILKFKIEENITDYIGMDGKLKVALRGAKDPWSDYDSVLWADKVTLSIDIEGSDIAPNAPPRTLPGQPVTAYCGNNECERHLGESYVNCPDDCPIAVCGDGTCEYPETPATCPDDCPVYCGNSICEASRGETYSTCPQDCQPYCGDGICSANEDCKSCAKDCGMCSVLAPLGVYRYLLAGMFILAGVLAYIFAKPEKKGGK